MPGSPCQGEVRLPGVGTATDLNPGAELRAPNSCRRGWRSHRCWPPAAAPDAWARLWGQEYRIGWEEVPAPSMDTGGWRPEVTALVTARARLPIRPPGTVPGNGTDRSPQPGHPSDLPKATRLLPSRASKSTGYPWLPSRALPTPSPGPALHLFSSAPHGLHPSHLALHEPRSSRTHVTTSLRLELPSPASVTPAFSTLTSLASLQPLIVWGLPLHISRLLRVPDSSPPGNLQPSQPRLLDQTPAWGPREHSPTRGVASCHSPLTDPGANPPEFLVPKRPLGPSLTLSHSPQPPPAVLVPKAMATRCKHPFAVLCTPTYPPGLPFP